MNTSAPGIRLAAPSRARQLRTVTLLTLAAIASLACAACSGDGDSTATAAAPVIGPQPGPQPPPPPPPGTPPGAGFTTQEARELVIAIQKGDKRIQDLTVRERQILGVITQSRKDRRGD